MVVLIILLFAICAVLFFLTQVIMLYKNRDLKREDFSLSGMLKNLHEDDVANGRKSASAEFIKFLHSLKKGK